MEKGTHVYEDSSVTLDLVLTYSAAITFRCWCADTVDSKTLLLPLRLRARTSILG